MGERTSGFTALPTEKRVSKQNRRSIRAFFPAGSNTVVREKPRSDRFRTLARRTFSSLKRRALPCLVRLI